MIDFKQKLELEEENNKAAKLTPVASEKIEKNYYPPKKNGRRFKNYAIAVIVVVIIFAGKIVISGQSAGQWINSSFLGNLAHLASNNDNNLQGNDSDRINLLLMGIGGAKHDGGYLADTIMLISLKPSTKQVAMLSVPRDLSIPDQYGTWRKVNSINALAEARNPGSGGPTMTADLSTVLGTDIKYYITVDFDAFIDIINELGGIDVNVERTLDDYEYPIRGQEDNPDYAARYEHLHIEKGMQHMNGETALKYARSRHAAGAEGSDFARARRQQLILEAVKTKLLSKNTLLKPGMISRIISDLSQNISTNLDAWSLLSLWKQFQSVDRSQIINKVLDDGPNGYLIARRSESGAYILIPKTGNFNNIQELVKNIFQSNTAGDVNQGKLGETSTNNKTNNTSTSTQTNNVDNTEKVKGSAKVVVLNGTWISGLAAKNGMKLQDYGFDVVETANAPTRAYDNPVIYVLNSQQPAENLSILEKASGASRAYDSPSWLENYKNDTQRPDFILIVGTKS